MSSHSSKRPKHLAWHETLETHELIVYQSTGLMKLKKTVGEIKDAQLKSIYNETIKGLEKNIKELLQFYKLAPSPRSDEDLLRNLDTKFYATDLLIFAKTAVRNYAIAITETATPQLRNTLNKQLQAAVRTHGKIFDFMYKKGYYPAYDFKKLLQNDIRTAQQALDMKY